MKKVIVIIEECHGEDVGVPIKEYFGENWQEKFLNLSEEDFDGSFYFEEQKYLE